MVNKIVIILYNWRGTIKDLNTFVFTVGAPGGCLAVGVLRKTRWIFSDCL